MKGSIGRASWAMLLAALAACAGGDPLSPELDETLEGSATLAPAPPLASKGKAPNSVDVVAGEGATMNAGITDGAPPPERTIELRDGTTFRPGR